MQVPINERIKIIFNSLGLTIKEISIASDNDYQTLSRCSRGDAIPRFDVMERLYLAFPQINAAYLLGGVEPVLVDVKKESVNEDLAAIKREYALMEELLEMYRKKVNAPGEHV